MKRVDTTWKRQAEVTKLKELRRPPLTSEEEEALLNAATNPIDRFILIVLLDTGLRVSEFCLLSKDDFDASKRLLRVKGKGGYLRVIPLTKRCFRLLEQFFKEHDNIKLTPRTVQKRLEKLSKRARLKRRISPHILRHTFAVKVLRKTGNLRALQLVLGHKNLETTSVYLRYVSSEQAAESLRELGWE